MCQFGFENHDTQIRAQNFYEVKHWTIKLFRGRKSGLKICPEAETIRPKMTIRPLDEQALKEILLAASNLCFSNYKFSLNICPEAETIRPKMTIRPLHV